MTKRQPRRGMLADVRPAPPGLLRALVHSLCAEHQSVAIAHVVAFEEAMLHMASLAVYQPEWFVAQWRAYLEQLAAEEGWELAAMEQEYRTTAADATRVAPIQATGG